MRRLAPLLVLAAALATAGPVASSLVGTWVCRPTAKDKVPEGLTQLSYTFGEKSVEFRASTPVAPGQPLIVVLKGTYTREGEMVTMTFTEARMNTASLKGKYRARYAEPATQARFKRIIMKNPERRLRVESVGTRSEPAWHMIEIARDGGTLYDYTVRNPARSPAPKGRKG